MDDEIDPGNSQPRGRRDHQGQMLKINDKRSKLRFRIPVPGVGEVKKKVSDDLQKEEGEV